MDNFDELMDIWETGDYDTLIARAKEAVENIISIFTPFASDDDDVSAIPKAMILASIYADGVVSEEERKMLSAVLDIDEDAAEELLSMNNSQFAEQLTELAQCVDADTKANILMLVLAFAAIDHKVNDKERAFLYELSK